MTPRAKKVVEAAPWEESVGFLPYKVTVYENVEKGWTLYLRWRHEGNWRKRSLRRPLRTPQSAAGVIDETVKPWAREQASAWYAKLVAGVPTEQVAPKAPLTIGQAAAKLTDPGTGKYPADTAHRREVLRELARAAVVWGAETPWETIRKAELRRLWRHRVREVRSELDPETGKPKFDGLRGAEVTVSRVLAVAAWLRDEELIPAGACVAPRDWKQQLAADWTTIAGQAHAPEPKRLRHTQAESLQIMGVAHEVDPRLHLALALGAELRLGQVLRCRRSDLDLTHRTLTVRGAGKKRGVVVKLTDGQMRAAREALEEGYLRELEAHCADYPLFPAGQMPGGRSGKPVAKVGRHDVADHIDRSVLDDWFKAAEIIAKVDHIPGRGVYGLRRAAVDAVKAAKISREGLKAHGGWTDTQVPDRIYADQEMDYARDEARDVRAKIRGETEDAPKPGTDTEGERTPDVPANETAHPEGVRRQPNE